MSSLIKVRNLSKVYQSKAGLETKAIDEVSLDVGEKEYLAIMGRSGSGKSTLLYQLGLLDRPSGGQIWLQGKSVVGLNRNQRSAVRLSKFGYVFQDYALIPELTALENVMIPLMMQGCGLSRCRNQGVKILETVGLSKRLNNRPSQLSGGEQQRVSVARALVNEPEVLFADEPTANLDSETARVVLDLFDDLQQQHNLTVVMVTHEEEYARRARRLIELSDGRLIKDEIIERNRTR